MADQTFKLTLELTVQVDVPFSSNNREDIPSTFNALNITSAMTALQRMEAAMDIVDRSFAGRNITKFLTRPSTVLATKVINVEHMVACPVCAGHGTVTVNVHGPQELSCTQCGGRCVVAVTYGSM